SFQQDIMPPSATGYRHWANIFRTNSVLHIISSKWKIRYDCIRHISDPKTMNRNDFPLSNDRKSTVYRISSLSSNFVLFLRSSVHQMRKTNHPSANAPSIAKAHIFFPDKMFLQSSYFNRYPLKTQFTTLLISISFGLTGCKTETTITRSTPPPVEVAAISA